MQIIGYLIFAVCLGLFLWYLISSIKVIITRIKDIKDKRKEKCAPGCTSENVSNAEVQGEINKNTEDI